MVRLAHFNNLPPRKEYIEKVRSVLNDQQPYTLLELQKKTRLTKTQVACTLESLLARGEILRKKSAGRQLYSLHNESSEP